MLTLRTFPLVTSTAAITLFTFLASILQLPPPKYPRDLHQPHLLFPPNMHSQIRIELPRKIQFPKPTRLGLRSTQAFFFSHTVVQWRFLGYPFSRSALHATFADIKLTQLPALGAAAPTCDGYARGLQQPADEKPLSTICGWNMPYSHSTP